MSKHWTAESNEDFRFRVAYDFVSQIEDAMERNSLTNTDLADILKVSLGRVSQVLNDPGNLTIQSVVDWSRALGKKAAVVLYDDDDCENQEGPINSDVFKECWEACGKPRDQCDFEVKESFDIQCRFWGDEEVFGTSYLKAYSPAEVDWSNIPIDPSRFTGLCLPTDHEPSKIFTVANTKIRARGDETFLEKVS